MLARSIGSWGRQLVFAIVLVPFLASAQDAGFVAAIERLPQPIVMPQPEPKPPVAAAYPLKLLANPATKDFHFALHDLMTIQASGEVATKIRAAYGTTPPGQVVTLVLDGIALNSLPYEFTQDAGASELLVSFSLSRDSTNDANRRAWNDLLAKQLDYEIKPAVYLKVGNDIAQRVDTGAAQVGFSINDVSFIRVVALCAIIMMMLLFGLLVLSDMLRDADTTFYSLGKSQMAFWGVLVFVSVVAVLLVTGTLERIPTQTLGLLGISGVTGLGAIIIGGAGSGSGVRKLRLEFVALKANKNRTELESARLEELKALLTPRNFIRDICDDGNGPSFHRVQVVLWTLLLGGVFLNSVAQVLSMPEFPESLLLLMGISNATYLGFKIPEKIANP